MILKIFKFLKSADIHKQGFNYEAYSYLHQNQKIAMSYTLQNSGEVKYGQRKCSI
jgi:hypothetical protein